MSRFFLPERKIPTAPGVTGEQCNRRPVTQAYGERLQDALGCPKEGGKESFEDVQVVDLHKPPFLPEVWRGTAIFVMPCLFAPLIITMPSLGACVA